MKKLQNPLKVPQEISAQDVVLLDESDPRALINIVPASLKDAIINLAENYPEYLELSEVELKNTLAPNETSDRLRVAFWYEYVAAQDAVRKMKLTTVFSEFCSDKYFYTQVLTDPKKVAWIVCRPSHYMMSLEASLNNGKNTLNKIMNMKVFDDEGNIKTKEATIFLKAYEMLDNRVRGSVIQRIEQKSVHYSGDDAAKIEELKKLREKQGDIDVTPKPEGS